VSFLVETGTAIAEIMKKEAPRARRHTHPGPRLRESITVEVEEDRRLVRVLPTVPYAIYVELGTEPSPGRYVPILEKRLVAPSVRNPDIGTHPGRPSDPFMKRTWEKAPEVIAKIADEYMAKFDAEILRKNLEVPGFKGVLR